MCQRIIYYSLFIFVRDNIPSIWPKDSVMVGIDVEDHKPILPLQMKGTAVTTQPLNNWSLKLASPIEEGLPKSEYHEQERRRYSQPHKAFTYRSVSSYF